MKSNNVITFPKANIRPSPPEDTEELRQKRCLDHVYMTMNEMCANIAADLADHGFDVIGKHNNDIALLTEALKSVLYRYYNMQYFLQPLADFAFEEKSPGMIHRVAECIEASDNDSIVFLKTPQIAVVEAPDGFGEIEEE